jgi:hypothetical protein
MNVAVLILAVCVSAALAVLEDARRSADTRNVRRLAEHFGWARSDASEAYRIARRVGFGSAYRTVRTERRRLPA